MWFGWFACENLSVGRVHHKKMDIVVSMVAASRNPLKLQNFYSNSQIYEVYHAMMQRSR